MNKKLLFLISLIVITTQCFTTQGRSADNGLRYVITSDSTVKVQKPQDESLYPKGKVAIPATVLIEGKTYTVTSIASWGFFGCNDITEVVIPRTITDIDIWAFTRCESLQRIEIPETVTRIGYAAFENCKSLKSISLPQSIDVVDERLFQECDSLTTVRLPSTIKAIKSGAFSRCKSLRSIVLPEGVTAIGPYAFAYNDSLQKINFPAALTSIGHDAFSGCGSLKTISLPDGLTTLGAKAFENCNSIECVHLPGSLTYMQGNPFASCSSLETITVGQADSAMVVVDGILYNHDITRLVFVPQGRSGKITLPASVKTVAPYACYECSKITEVRMKAVEYIGEAAFHGCRGLNVLKLGSALKGIDKAAFYSCTALTDVVLPTSMEYLGMNAFEFCPSLKRVSLDEKLTQDEKKFNNLSFRFNSSNLIFTIRKAGGKTATMTYDQLPDMTRYFINR
ncbi:MAG: leucine-rich repeat protein [Muribaculaceae bacterium]|nr:leucine-rich repeat protein [Muribaculaceae bacterium]